MGTAPPCVVTDQDPAMRIAIEHVFADSRHRFCMWHIMTKVGEKVGPDLGRDEAFRSRLNGIVWNAKILPATFDEQWQSLMEKYNLVEHRWFSKLLELRRFWIPAFFTDMRMSGLLRTTSISEAENSAFGKFTNPHGSLVELFLQFNSVLDAQRHKHAKLDAACEGSLPELKTRLSLERHAAQVFTLTVFYELQKEIVAGCFSCRVVGIHQEGAVMCYDIKGVGNEIFSIQHWPADNSVVCNCKLFQRLGWVCRHMFMVFKDSQVPEIPIQYVAQRWTKTITRPDLGNRCESSGVNSTNDRGTPLETSLLWAEIHACLGLAGAHEERVKRLKQVISGLSKEFSSDGLECNTGQGNNHAIEALCGIKPPGTISIKPPVIAKNKGSGRRIKSSREKAIELSAKPKRMCRTCKQSTGHDSRNCPTV